MRKYNIKIRKSGEYKCKMCKISGKYDHTYEPNKEILDIGYTNGMTIFLDCKEHDKNGFHGYMLIGSKQ